MLLSALLGVWASYDAPTVCAYRGRKITSPRSAAVMLVQPHLDSVLGGVCFSRDPGVENPAAMRVEVADTPARVVAGDVAAAYRINRVTGRASLLFGRPDAPLVTAALLDRLLHAALLAECALDHPVDLEWLVASSATARAAPALVIVQARPITAIVGVRSAGAGAG